MRARRQRLRLSQRALGALVGLRGQTITAIENKRRNLTLDNLDRIAAALGTTPVALITPADTPPCAFCHGRGRPGYTCNTCGVYTPART